MSDLAQFLPWQRDFAANWLSQRERFAHAWLIHGLPGIGKRQFALAAAGSLLCESPNHGLACGHCAACLWLISGNHPALRPIRPDEIGRASCWDSVCQYVLMSGGAVPLKKKK